MRDDVVGIMKKRPGLKERRSLSGRIIDGVD